MSKLDRIGDGRIRLHLRFDFLRRSETSPTESQRVVILLSIFDFLWVVSTVTAPTMNRTPKLRCIWVDFVGCVLRTERLFPWQFGFPLSKTNL